MVPTRVIKLNITRMPTSAVVTTQVRVIIREKASTTTTKMVTKTTLLTLTRPRHTTHDMGHLEDNNLHRTMAMALKHEVCGTLFRFMTVY